MRKGIDPFRSLNTLGSIVAAMSAGSLGIALLVLSAIPRWPTSGGVWQVLLQQFGSALVVAVGLASIWELYGKRAFARELLTVTQLIDDVETSGLDHITTAVRTDVDWARYFSSVHELDLFLVAGHSWRGSNWTNLQKVAERSRTRIRIFLPDYTNDELMSTLERRYNKTAAQLEAEIIEALREYRRLGAPPRVRVLLTGVNPLFSLHRFDDTIVVSLKSHRKGRQDVPTLVCHAGGTLYRFFDQEFQEIARQSAEALAAKG